MLAIFIYFSSRKFDVTKEPENRINPVHGQSFLAWLRPKLEDLGCRVHGPDAEDWGWYLEVQDAQTRHMIGASAHVGRWDVCWTVHVQRWRRFREWLFRTATPPSVDDPLVQTIFRLAREHCRGPRRPQ